MKKKWKRLGLATEIGNKGHSGEHKRLTMEWSERGGVGRGRGVEGEDG